MTKKSKTRILKGGEIITAEKSFFADILIEDEIIKKIGIDLSADEADIIDVSGMKIMPGGVDPHTHFDLPMFGTVSSDDHYTGHKAAAFGGTTTVMDFVPQIEDGTLAESINQWHQKADHKAAIDFSFHMNITKLDEKIEKEIPKLIELGIPTLKVFMAYNGVLRISDDEIERVLEIASKNNMLTMVHAENGDAIEKLVSESIEAGNKAPIDHALTRPAWTAGEAVMRVTKMASQLNAKLYVVHMNSEIGAEMLRKAREENTSIYGETCPQYLYFTDEAFKREDGAKWICSPPMRKASDQQALWQAIKTGDMLVIGTDHCPFFFDGTKEIEYEGKMMQIAGKELGADDFRDIPNGLPTVQDRLPILWSFGVNDGKISENQFVALTSTNPAKLFGLFPKKGLIAEGSDADLVIWDPNLKIEYGVEKSHHRTDYNLYEGWKLTGYPIQVYLRGNLIVDHGNWAGKAGMGKFLLRKSSGNL
jgi:dihydropyrimidinase